MAGAMPAAGAVGGVVSAYGSLLNGQNTANSLNAQAGMQRVQAGEALQAGNYDAYRQALMAREAQGRATAALGASGVASGSSSEQAVLMSGAINAELDRQNILHGADIRATNYENQASLDSFGASKALEGSYFSALAGVLGGASSGIANLTASGAGSPDVSSGLTTAETAQLGSNLSFLNTSPESAQVGQMGSGG